MHDDQHRPQGMAASTVDFRSKSCPQFRLGATTGYATIVTVRIVLSSDWHTTSFFDLKSPDSTGHLFILLFLFQFSFFLWIKLGLFLLFPFAFIFFSLIAHICFSLVENDLLRTVAPKTRLRLHRLADEIDWCHARQSLVHFQALPDMRYDY